MAKKIINGIIRTDHTLATGEAKIRNNQGHGKYYEKTRLWMSLFSETEIIYKVLTSGMYYNDKRYGEEISKAVLK